MTERGLPSADGSPACPFVAFEDDRDQRADRPDHRHRCFADTEPAPRALAHQEAYCLSSAFPVCPVFQEWARREAARATHVEDAPPPLPIAATTMADLEDGPATAGDGDDRHVDAWGMPPDQTPIEERPHRNPPRDWAAPPPWAGAGAGGPGRSTGAGRRDGEPDVAAEFLAARSEEGGGLAGSAADRLAGGAGGRGSVDPAHRPSRSLSRPEHVDSPAAPADPELAGLVGGSRSVPARSITSRSDAGHIDLEPERRPARRPTVSSTRDRGRDRDRDREVAERSSAHDGPAWERGRRFEAYPTIKTRAGLSGVTLPRVVVLFGALVVAAIALFFLPALLGVGGDDPAQTARPSTSAPAATASPSPTPVPEPTAQTYTVKSGDTLSKIARDHGLTLDQLREANPEITNPNRISVGDVIIIPTPSTDGVDGGEASPAPSP